MSRETKELIIGYGAVAVACALLIWMAIKVGEL